MNSVGSIGAECEHIRGELSPLPSLPKGSGLGPFLHRVVSLSVDWEDCTRSQWLASRMAQRVNILDLECCVVSAQLLKSAVASNAMSMSVF